MTTASTNGAPATTGGGLAARCFCLIGIVFSGLSSRKLQVLLTLFTMGIGAFSLSATSFVGAGALQDIWSELDQFMGNRAVIFADSGPDDLLLTRRPDVSFTPADLDFVRRRAPLARYVVPVIFRKTQLGYANSTLTTPVDGISPEMQEDAAYSPLSGRGLSSRAHKGLVYECLLTESAARGLKVSLADHPYVRAGTLRFLMVGIVPDPPEADPAFRARLIIPYFTAQMLNIGEDPGSDICVAWHTPEQMAQVMAQVCSALDECRGPGTYVTSSSQFKIQKGREIVRNFIVFGTLLAGFCILVAAIGITNVMLATVVRRTREFAIRIAVGARRTDLGLIVAAEGCCLGVLGALVGIGTALLTSSWLCQFVAPMIPHATKLEPRWTQSGVALPLLLCAASGLVAGIVPAIKATRLDILAALRAE